MGSGMRSWLVAALAAWLVVGVILVDWANRRGLTDSVNLSPYHVVGYVGLAVLGIYAVWRTIVGIRRGSWRAGFAPGYDGLAIGFGLAAAWVVADVAWQQTMGIGLGFENAIAPTRLMIPSALVFVAAGPVREALANRPPSPWLAAAAVAALALVGSAVTLTAFNPIREPLQDYEANQGLDSSEIWVMSSDGSSQQRLLPAVGNGVDYSLPAWSPDGTRIAFTAWSNRPGLAQNWRPREQTAAIWTMAADGSDLRLVVDGAPDQAWIPAWSPDGTTIAYTVTSTGAATSAAAEPLPNRGPTAMGPVTPFGGSTTWLVGAGGGDVRPLTGDRAGVMAAVWSPNGDELAYIRSTGLDTDVFVATYRAGSLVGERAIAPSAADDWTPAWAPDGHRIAFTSSRGGSDDVWIVNVDGTGLTQLTMAPGLDAAPAWSPDGASISFVSDRTGVAEVWTMPASGGEARNLTTDPSAADGKWSVAYSPDGSSLAYARSGFQAERASGFARWELMAAESILFGLLLSILALALVALGTPVGAFTVVLVVVTALGGLPTDELRFVPGALIAGVITDVIIRLVRARDRARVAAALFPVAATLAAGLTIGFGGTLAWSLTMLLGVVTITALLGWGLAVVVARLGPVLGARDTTPVPG
ncbi:MAG TPA: hypothetical protein VK831_02690 [Candidatus Deferrimicrobiaceae bacterium]|nr:hypothetical protein [Candidatus Deferrimicrobiaceae bacterium]